MISLYISAALHILRAHHLASGQAVSPTEYILYIVFYIFSLMCRKGNIITILPFPRDMLIDVLLTCLSEVLTIMPAPYLNVHLSTL